MDGWMDGWMDGEKGREKEGGGSEGREREWMDRWMEEKRKGERGGGGGGRVREGCTEVREGGRDIA